MSRKKGLLWHTHTHTQTTAKKKKRKSAKHKINNKTHQLHLYPYRKYTWYYNTTVVFIILFTEVDERRESWTRLSRLDAVLQKKKSQKKKSKKNLLTVRHTCCWRHSVTLYHQTISHTNVNTYRYWVLIPHVKHPPLKWTSCRPHIATKILSERKKTKRSKRRKKDENTHTHKRRHRKQHLSFRQVSCFLFLLNMWNLDLSDGTLHHQKQKQYFTTTYS